MPDNQTDPAAQPATETAAAGAATPETSAQVDAATASGAAPAGGRDTMFPDLDGDAPSATPSPAPRAGADGSSIDAMLNVGLNVQVVLGQARMPISQLLELSRGSVIELNKKIGAPVDLVINDRLIARGDLVKVGEDRLGVTLTEIVKDHVASV